LRDAVRTKRWRARAPTALILTSSITGPGPWPATLRPAPCGGSLTCGTTGQFLAIRRRETGAGDLPIGCGERARGPLPCPLASGHRLRRRPAPRIALRPALRQSMRGERCKGEGSAHHDERRRIKFGGNHSRSLTSLSLVS